MKENRKPVGGSCRSFFLVFVLLKQIKLKINREILFTQTNGKKLNRDNLNHYGI
jgi:hypothetical protein